MDNAITVSQLNRYVKARIEEDRHLKDLFLSGEISNLTNHYRSGHIYFVLKDSAASVRAVMFRSNAQNLRFALSDGMQVVVRCGVSLYERDGSYQIYVREIIPDGTGALYLRFEQLKEKLAREGLFAPEHKRPLPRYPKTVGIVTSPTGAALQDMLNIIGRRWPLCTVLFAPATVQGEGAAATIITAMRRLTDSGRCDVLIVGRGGGSIEDLWAFNDEALARAVFNSPVPVVSAVGHETDYTICDFVGDVRAPTPSAAAELTVPDMRDVLFMLSGAESTMEAALDGAFARAGSRLDAAASRVAAFSPKNRLQESARRVENSALLLSRAVRRGWGEKRAALESAAQLVDSLSPLHILERGYGILLREDMPLRSVEALSPGDVIAARLRDGRFTARVLETLPGLETDLLRDGEEKNA